MILDPKLISKYNLYIPYFEFIQNSLDQTLMNYSKKHLYAYSSRIKTLESLSEKIETGRYKSWNEIDDLIGCVIIVPNLNYENEVLNFLKSAFIMDTIRKRGSSYKNHDTFRFDSTRFIGNLKKVNDSAKEEIFAIKFEIQIRSAFEHAWSVTTHDLAYKSSTINWQMLRLASQLKSSVEQLDMITLSASEVSKQITKYKWPEIDIKIDILNFLTDCFDKKTIPNELKPKDFSRVVENIFALIVTNLSIWKPRKWKNELNEILKKIDLEFLNFQKTGFPMSLSLFQIVFGILAKHNFINSEKLKSISFFKCDSFNIIFPELLNIKMIEFDI